MRAEGAAGPGEAALLQQEGDFGGKARKGGEAAAKAGDDQQPPFRGKVGAGGEEGDGQADDVGADQVGDQGAGRQGRQQRIELFAQLPAQQGAERRTKGHGKDRFPHGQGQFRKAAYFTPGSFS